MFEPNDSWLEGLRPGPAVERLEESGFEPWPDIQKGEEIGFGWALLVSDQEAELLERAPDVPGFRWPAVGILDPEVDRGLETQRQQFGVIFYAEDPRAEPTLLDYAVIAGTELPIVLRPITRDEHGSSPSLPNGAIACWATSAGGEREGWLTARHVALAGGYRLADCGPECIDAALIDLAQRGGGSPTRAVPPSPGARIAMRSSEAAHTTILDVALNLRIRSSSYFPLRFTTSTPGQPGDSGSLIVGDPCGEPLGIYLGAARVEGGEQRAGFGLAITQLEDLMNMEVYL